MKTAPGFTAQACQPSAISASPPSVAMPKAAAWMARVDYTVRVAHTTEHQARSSGVA